MFVFRDIVGNLLAFPLTLAMILLALVFTGKGTEWGITSPPSVGNLWVPPFLFLPGGESATAALQSLIGLGIILMTPQAVQMAKDAVKAPTFLGKYGAAIGQALGVGPRVVGGTASQAYQFKEKRRMEKLWKGVAERMGQREG